MSAESRIQARRRIAMRAGLLLLVMASVTACIFDRSEYKGGGRLDKGATADTASSSASATETAPTDEPTSEPPQQDAASILDAGGSGD
jgi:hypothetical protein